MIMNFEYNDATKDNDAFLTDADIDDSYENLLLEPEIEQLVTNLRISMNRLKKEIGRHENTLNALRHREQWFQHLFQQAPIAVGVVGSDGQFIQINEQMASMTGYSEKALMAMGLKTITFHHDYVQTLQSMNALIKGEQSCFQEEKRFIRKNGTVFWCKQTLSLMEKPCGGKCILQLIVDIDQQKKAQEALEKAHEDLEFRIFQRTAQVEAANQELREEIQEKQKARDDLLSKEKHLKAVQAIAAVGSFFALPNSQNLDCSEGFFRLFGYEPDQAVADYAFIKRHIHSRDQQRFENDITQLKNSFAPFDNEYKIVNPKGGIRDIRMIVTTLMGPDNTPREFQGVVQDITESKAMERQVLQNEKLASLGFMASGVAHEINNPNNLISFNIPILRDYLEALFSICDSHAGEDKNLELCGMLYPEFKSDVVKLTNNIENGSARINKIVSNFRSFVHMKRDLEYQKVDIKALIRQCIELSDAKMKKLVHCFDVNIPDNLPKVNTEPEVLEIAVINLLINAVQACDKPDSHVSLSAAYEHFPKPRLIIQVSDNGCGMDHETISRAFDPFFSTKASNQGTGIGLSLCHNLVSSLGGNIEVESFKGKGSTFKIILPDRHTANQSGPCRCRQGAPVFINGHGPT